MCPPPKNVKDGQAVISIKKYLDLESSELNKFRPPSSAEVLVSVLEAYRAALNAIGNSALRVCPALGPSLRRSLMPLSESLTNTLTPLIVKETEGQGCATWKLGAVKFLFLCYSSERI
jgi:hypothetical protein